MSAVMDDGFPGHDNEIIAAITGEIEGQQQDCRYSDPFIAIKTEIDKPSGVDRKTIVDNALLIFREYAKDLRVYAYFLSSYCFERDLAGLTACLRALPLLLERFSSELFPPGKSARINTLQWLNSPRLTGLAERHYAGMDGTEASELKQALTVANTALAEHIDEGLSIRCFDTVIGERTDQETSQIHDTGRDIASAGDGRPEFDARRTIRHLVDHYLERAEYEAAVDTSRAWRWCTVTGIPNDRGLTRIPEPRQTLTEVAAEDPVERFVLLERAFMEAGAQYLFQLQFRQYRAAVEADLSGAATAIAGHVIRFIDRIPDLCGMRYANGMPFVDEVTASWLREIRSGTGNHRQENDIDEDPFSEADAYLLNGQTGKAIEYLAHMPVTGKAMDIRRQLRLHEILEAGGSSSLALAALRRVYREIVDYHAAHWDQELVAEVVGRIRNIGDRNRHGLPDDSELCELLFSADIPMAMRSIRD